MIEASIPQTFAVISGESVDQAIRGREHKILDLVRYAYRLHGAGSTINPPSYFLKYPDNRNNRIIALPASVGGDVAVSGIKWVSSFPENVDFGIPRASAVIILNDPSTGYPFACLEGSIISAVRTAASAAVAATCLTKNRKTPTSIGIVGTGLIAKYVMRYLKAAGFSFSSISLYDKSMEYACSFAESMSNDEDSFSITTYDSLEDLICSSDLLVFTTTALTPYVTDRKLFSHHPVVLHVSLRDLSPQIVLDSCNIVDDVDHCLKAETSVHLAEKISNSRKHVHATLNEVLSGHYTPEADQTIVFSPFGLGVLDLVVAREVFDHTSASGAAHTVNNFFYDMSRHGV